MKKLILSILFILCLSFQASAWNPMVVVSGSGSGATPTDYSQDASCEGAWRMNVNNGTELDRSGNSIDLLETTSQDMPTNADDPYTDASGVSRDIEVGDLECLYIAHASAGGTHIYGDPANFSIVAWFKAETVVNGTVYAVVAKWNEGGTNDLQYQVAIKGTNTNEFHIRFRVSADGAAEVTATSTVTNYVTGTWYHVAAVSDDTNIKLYVNNGSPDDTSHTTGIFDGDADFQVGGTGYPTGLSYGFDGLIDEVAVFSRALSAGEISNIYTDGLFGDQGSGD